MSMKPLWNAIAGAVVITVALSLTGCPEISEIVIFKDQGLENAVRRELGLPFGVLTVTQLRELRSLDARELDIADLSGLDKCPNLTWLNLEGNSVSDLTPLANLTGLMTLVLDANEIEDLTPLAGLINLDVLSLRDNRIADIQALVTNAVNGGLGPGDQVLLSGNDLSARALSTDIPDLIARGVNVVTDSTT